MAADLSITGKPRQAWLDYVRLGSIFLVVLFHTPPRLPLLDDAVVFNMRVPVFFAISGFLYSHGRWATRFRDFLAHRARQILVPYATFFLLFYLLWLAVGRAMEGAAEQAIPVYQPVLEWATGNPRTVCGPFWYIACLFTMQVGYYWLCRAVDSPARRLAVALALSVGYQAAGYLVPFSLYVPFWNITHAIQFLPFYALGDCARTALQRVEFSSVRATVALLLAFAASIAVAIAALPVADEWLKGLIRIGCGFALLPAYLAAGKAVARRAGTRRWVQMIVVNGTVYLALQNYAIGICRIALDRMAQPGFLDLNPWCKPVVALLVMAAIFPFAWLIHHHAPWMLGKKRDAPTRGSGPAR